MPVFKAIEVGASFGRLAVNGPVLVEFDERVKRNRFYYPCRCECGNSTLVRADKLAGGKTLSCGCLMSEVRTRNQVKPTHGLAHHPVYSVWRGMVARCTNPDNVAWERYGGRGITVCPEWSDPTTFVEWAVSNGFRPDLQIDRRDNDRGYSPDNCHFVTPKDNARNTHRTIWLDAFGERKRLVEWLDDPRCVVSGSTLRRRVNRGWDAEKAITTA